MSAKSKTVLMIGGPADGRWMVTDGHDIIVAAPASIDWTIGGPVIPDIRQIHHRVETFAVFGLRVEIAVADGEFRSSAERNKAIIRALFQRDVAEAMGAYR